MQKNTMPEKFIPVDVNDRLNDNLTCEIKRVNEKITMTFTGFTCEEEIQNFYNVQLLLWGAEQLPEKLN